MNSLFALTILVAIFSLADCECEKYYPWTIKEIGCLRNMSAAIRSTMIETKCQTRPTHVELKPLEGYVFLPPVISINQCTGSCANNACQPSKTKNVTRHVRRIATDGPRKGISECIVLEVEEHENCSCMCNIRATDCNNQQYYDQPTCKCKCKDQKTKKANCEKNLGKKWMEEMCDCRCMMMIQECSGGTEWNSVTCTCENL